MPKTGSAMGEYECCGARKRKIRRKESVRKTMIDSTYSSTDHCQEYPVHGTISPYQEASSAFEARTTYSFRSFDIPLLQ